MLSKHLILVAVVCFCSLSNANAQKEDAIWLLSNNSIAVGDKCGIDFNDLPPTVFIDYRKLGFLITSASICDSTGSILFYTNGIHVANKEHGILWNSGDFNPGYASDYYWYPGLGFSQGAIILPRPDNPEKYLIFHVSGEEFEAYDENQLQPLHLGMSEVDMALDGGLGGIPVNRKNIHIIEDTITQGRITAIKHANGRDWWVVQHKFYSDLFYKLLVQPDTVLVSSQASGPVQTSNDILGMAKFSPDGSKYCFLNNNLTFDLFDFDRCSGEFSNPLAHTVPDSLSDLPLTLGCEFSPNGRFLYVNTYKHLYQYDLWAADIQASVIEVGEWDTTYLPIATYFFMPQLAPDNKIYISTYGGTPYLHLIEQPDSLGLSCNFSQHSFALPEFSSTVPNFPNYELGKMEDSPCDTLFNSTPNVFKDIRNFRLGPNPANEWLNIIYNTKEDCLLTLYDFNGKQVASVSLFHYFKNRVLDVSQLPSGIYLAYVLCKGEKGWSDKVVVQH